MNTKKFVYSTSQIVRYQFPTHINDLVLDRSEAVTSEVFIVVLGPGQAPPLHQHHDTEQIFYILEGEGVLRTGEEEKEHEVRIGDVVRIPPCTLHSIRCRGEKTLKYLAIDCFVGGRPKEEPTWDSHARILCKNNGWDYNHVLRNSRNA